MKIMGFELPDALGTIIQKNLDLGYGIDGFKEFKRDLENQIENSRKYGEISAATAAYLRWRFLSGEFIWGANCDVIEIVRKEGFEEGYTEEYKRVLSRIRKESIES